MYTLKHIQDGEGPLSWEHFSHHVHKLNIAIFVNPIFRQYSILCATICVWSTANIQSQSTWKGLFLQVKKLKPHSHTTANISSAIYEGDTQGQPWPWASLWCMSTTDHVMHTHYCCHWNQMHISQSLNGGYWAYTVQYAPFSILIIKIRETLCYSLHCNVYMYLPKQSLFHWWL